MGSLQSFKTSRVEVHFIRGAILFLGIALWCYGLSCVPIVSATLMTFIIPLFVLMLAPIFLKEKVNKHLIFATIVGFIGALISLNVIKIDFSLTSLALLVSAFLFASLDIINKKFVMQESMLSMLFYSALVTSILGAIPAYLVWQSVGLHDLLILGYLGAGSNIILFCLLKAFARVTASSVAPYRYLELFFSAAIGFIIFSETPNSTMIIGSLLIIPSTIYVTISKAKSLS